MGDLREDLIRLAEEWEHGDAMVARWRNTRPSEYAAAIREILASHPTPSLAPPCHCTYEAGDSPCPMHGMDEEPAPSPRSEAESDCVCGHPYLAHVGVHHGCIGIDCGPGCVDECQGAGCHCTRYRPRAPVPAESATTGEEDGR